MKRGDWVRHKRTGEVVAVMNFHKDLPPSIEIDKAIEGRRNLPESEFEPIPYKVEKEKRIYEFK